MKENLDSLTPTEFIALVNQTLEYAYSSVLIKGEVASYKVNQGKWVFFDLKDESSSVSCFMPVWSLRMPIEDGMMVVARGLPKVINSGRFSFTVNMLMPVGDGGLKKAFELLKKKLGAEGLFDEARKRPIPKDLTKLGVITSTGAAGYADFVKILNARWGGIEVQVAHTQVQGMDAPDQMIRALKYFNEKREVQAIAMIRGGGSADDLACFNDEKLVREIAASGIPVITGIGHEVDESLADLVADMRASTPSNVAELLTRDRVEEKKKLEKTINRTKQAVMQNIEQAARVNREKMMRISESILTKYIDPSLNATNQKTQKCFERMNSELKVLMNAIEQKMKVLKALDPMQVLNRGYAIISGRIAVGEKISITLSQQVLEATINNIKERKKNE